MSKPTNQNSFTRRTVLGVGAGTAAVAAVAPATAMRPAAFGDASAYPSGVSAIEILSDEIISLVRKRRTVNTAIDKLRATVAVQKKGTSVDADPFGLKKSLSDAQVAKDSLNVKTSGSALEQEVAAQAAIDDLLWQKMRNLKALNPETPALASLQRHTLEGARTEMLVAV